MQRFRLNRTSVALALAAALLLVSAAVAQGPELLRQAGAYDLSWWTVDGGGTTTTTSGGTYTLGGTAGQPDAAPALASGAYTLTGGFWPGTAGAQRLYLPLVLRNP